MTLFSSQVENESLFLCKVHFMRKPFSIFCILQATTPIHQALVALLDFVFFTVFFFLSREQTYVMLQRSKHEYVTFKVSSFSHFNKQKSNNIFLILWNIHFCCMWLKPTTQSIKCQIIFYKFLFQQLFISNLITL